MTDIEFDQIREGQTVRLHTKHRLTVEGEVSAHEGNRVRIGMPRFAVLTAVDITRVELLAEPAPKWEVGQLAEIDWRDEFGDGARTAVMAWGGDFWCPLAPGKIVRPGWVVGEPRLMVVVPADSRVVTQDCVVLPPKDPNGRPWSASNLRAYAHRSDFNDTRPYAYEIFNLLADAIEEAQR